MANIFKIDRTGNEIILGTTGTTINIASHTASKLLSLDSNKDLSSDSSLLTPTFANLNLTETGANDPTILFTSASNSAKIFLDESFDNDGIIIEGQTASKNTLMDIRALDGQNAQLFLHSGANYSYIEFASDDNLWIVNNVQDKDIIFQINDGGVTKTINWDAETDKLKHSAGTFDFDDDNITTTGTVNTKGFIAGLVTKTGAYTATAADYTIICNASGGAFTITLPAAASHTGRIYHIKKIDSSVNAVTVDGNVSETIDDGLTAVLTVQYESITIQSDGSEWWIL